MTNFFQRCFAVLSYREADNNLFLKGLKETLTITLISCFIAFFIGIFLGFCIYWFKINNLKKRYFVSNACINILISTPFLLLIILFIKFFLFPCFHSSYGTKVGVISLILVLCPLFARHCEQIFITVNPELYQTAYSLGANKWQFFHYFLLKETRSDIILKTVSLFITSLAYSSVLGIIGHQGLGVIAISHGYQGDASFFQGFNSLDLIITFVLANILLTQIVQLCGGFVAAKLDKR